jgi:magnesium-transporting ATPase (P-type)
MAFTVMVLAQLFNVFNARSDRTSAFATMFTNGLVWGAVAVSAALQVLVVYAPFLNEGFGTTPLAPADWAVCIAAASLVLWVDELWKVVRRQRWETPSAPRGGRSRRLKAEVLPFSRAATR